MAHLLDEGVNFTTQDAPRGPARQLPGPMQEVARARHFGRRQFTFISSATLATIGLAPVARIRFPRQNDGSLPLCRNVSQIVNSTNIVNLQLIHRIR